ncbi:MAG: hypothetical protein JWM12_2774 [Ilumatobacteraceae bacterium]|jgi:hypothetical protein|nr:hypothetical protein [Ilumatobacteraceae bacterium]
MANDDETEATIEDPHAGDPSAAEEADRVGAYDLNEDGHISPIESARATLGLVDARLEEVAHEPGLKGRIADAVHHVVDKLDND